MSTGMFNLSSLSYLVFSDTAKIATVARNIFNGVGFCSDFSFFNYNYSELLGCLNFAGNIPPLYPWLLSIVFRIFGSNDIVIIYLGVFLFLLSAVSIFFLARKVTNGFVGLLVSLLYLSNVDFISYATSGSSEILFTLLTTTAFMFAISEKRYVNILSLLFLIPIYLTRQFSFLYILPLVIIFVSKITKSVKKIIIFSIFAIAMYVAIDIFVFSKISGTYFIYSVFNKGVATSMFDVNESSDLLRGVVVGNYNFVKIIIKFIYNIYNYFKLIPSIVSPYLFPFFVIGLLYWSDHKTYNIFKLSVYILFITAIITSSLTIPLLRYIHPIVPLIYIISVHSIYVLISKIITCKKHFKLYLAVLVSIFGLIQPISSLLIDSRYYSETHNTTVAPVYVTLSKSLQNNTSENDIILTNLDTWGSWYGYRKTVWYPLEPNMIIPNDKGNNPFDAIYLTSYLIDDENYRMGDEWRQIFNSPENIENEYIRANYKLKEIIEIPAEETYEKIAARAVLLVRK